MTHFNFVLFSDKVRDTAYHIKSSVASGQSDDERYVRLYLDLIEQLPEDWKERILTTPQDIRSLVKVIERELLMSGRVPERIEAFSALLRLGLLIQEISERSDSWRRAA